MLFGYGLFGSVDCSIIDCKVGGYAIGAMIVNSQNITVDNLQTKNVTTSVRVRGVKKLTIKNCIDEGFEKTRIGNYHKNMQAKKIKWLDDVGVDYCIAKIMEAK